MIQWQAEIKPPSHVCPQDYCWNWVKADARFAPGFHDSIEEAWEEVKPVMVGTCSIISTFGYCSRTGEGNDIGDFYEPNEPALANDGLPWFYFITSPKMAIFALSVENAKMRL